MGDVVENKTHWEDEWDWSDEGERWSAWWGGTPALWHGALLPRIHAFVPTGTILEIAPGFGRWTQYLKDLGDRLVIVDLTQRCIDHCRQRFAESTNIEYHVNDGRSLAMVHDSSVDLAFSFDSLVHVEADVLEAYLAQLARKLKPDGVGFFHHSNSGGMNRNVARLARRTPQRVLRPMVNRGALIDVYAWRSESVTTDVFAELCERAGLACVSQEKICWEHGPYLMDALSMFTPRGSRWDRPRRVMSNRFFRHEARRMANLYGLGSFPARDRGL
jgi:SAM-dependent methyltransferase